MNLAPLLEKIGLHSEKWVELINTSATVLLVALIGWIVYIAAKKWLARLVMRIAKHTPFKWDDLLFDQRFFNRFGMLLVPIVIRIALHFIEWKHIGILHVLVEMWITVASVFLISAVLEGIVRIYENFAVSRDRPIRVFKQVIMIFLWCAAVLTLVHILTGKDILVLLGGLTAFAAVLMLIFQDSILGFVAGIQMSANNMVRVGDWIVMPARGVDGDVIDITLTTVKVQNWDKTITTIPTHKLVSESFTNWRGMEESGGRRIKRSVNIDVNSVHYLTAEDIDRMRESELLREYIDRKKKEIDDYNAKHSSPLDARRMTNLGTFREYLETLLEKNAAINQDMTHMVRQLQPGPSGLPLEVYCFSARKSWVDYENVQSDIFDHIYAVMPLFGLRAYQYQGVVEAQN